MVWNVSYKQRKAEVFSWTEMHNKSKIGLSKRDTTGCSHLGWQRWVVSTIRHKSDAGVQQSSFVFWATIFYLSVLRLGTDFHCSCRYQSPSLWWDFRAFLHSWLMRIIPLFFLYKQTSCLIMKEGIIWKIPPLVNVGHFYVFCPLWATQASWQQLRCQLRKKCVLGF